MPLVTKFKILKDWLFQNRGDHQTIAKNTIWLLIGQISSRLLRSAIVIYAARILGAESWGAFSYALGIATFLTTFSDIGINALITKEASRQPELKNKYLATAFFTKTGILIILISSVFLFFPYLTKIPEAAAIMPILVFVFAFDSLRDLGSALSRALEKMQIEALINIFTNLAIVILGFILLFNYQTAYSLALAYAIGSGIGLIAIIITLREHFKNIFTNFQKSMIKTILVTAWPFGLMSLMGVIMLNTDIIMLGWMRSPAEIGYYSVSQKIIQLLYVLPALFASSIFPALSRYVKTDPEKAKKLLEKSVALAILIALPITALGLILDQPIIQLLFGPEYLPSITSFKILIITLLIVYPSTLVGNAIFAYDKQRNFIFFVGIAFIGNIAFNWLFIPRFGIEGAAAATVLTQLITNGLIWKKMKSVNQFKIWPQIQKILKLK
ncbi:MAG: hypothetical protein A3I24_02630 [Candidatus Harrisonbacteria bacterium RIFCSPLOWO2_02_FULL_41_13b]|uniref:Uncharacterized protein n=1 Tax=Candidatus Harrisonbacteria bacterium RIFCSPLOWO2_02_FULL_41_13b TaxID=1798409 RepID=A0A1G1ZR07_9BACT|nr:MAG: hypothetical protein A3J53_00420 [Candidatus Harrisonbacteria bacterium RIFCSPHIGHO2_02_FULL_40_20]OGY67054.1 MAG: hypothetical protein A3I24_02630 [Candidatus Harrisonbacteria bacterium RIFCSPLOWO2_02_FULL_41_13b]